MTTLFAYINPFIGSLLLQFLALGLVFASVFVWKIKTFFRSLFGIKQETKADAESADSPSIKIDESSKEDKKAA